MDKKFLYQVVEHCLAAHAARVAVEDDVRQLSYAGLDRASARLLLRLRAAGVGRGDVVALAMPSGIAYVTALLACVRCGAIFMPVDPAFPPARLQRLLALAPPRALVSDDPMLLERLGELAPAAHRLPATVDSGEGAPALPACEAGEDDTGYLIATSGSTGEPKLIAGRNKGVSHFVHWEVAEFGIDSAVRASFLAPPGFDVSLREIFVPLLAGGTLVIPPAAVRNDARRLLGWLRERRISLLHCVPSLLRLLTRALVDEGGGAGLPDLRLLASAGEPLYGGDVSAWRQAAGRAAEMVNLYGPSETTLAKAFHRIGDDVARNAIVPLGKPVANTALLVLRDGRLCGIGETGELHVQTPFASNGYWGHPDLTDAAFVPNPLAPGSALRIYRTGDLARYLPDRSVEFVGRADRQVKVDGVRVELPEIELAMRRHAAVTEGVAQAFHTAQGTSVVGYYTAAHAVAAAALREAMAEVLPSAMMPAYLLQLPEFPRNLNGKVDRRALPRPQALLEQAQAHVAPEGEHELAIAGLWAEALGLERVGATSAFLEIGGNSLRAIGLVGRIGQRFGVELGLREFFEAGTVRALAARVASRKAARGLPIPRAPQQDHHPLTPAQAGLWVLDRIDDAATLYNTVEWLELRGALDLPQLEAALQGLVRRHEALRTAYVQLDGEPRQQVRAPAPLRITLEEAGALARERVLALLDAEQRHRFDLAAGSLLRVTAVRESSACHHLIINMHHIACDGWSMRQLVTELMQDYQGGPVADAAAAANPHGSAQRSVVDLAHWLATRARDAARAQTWRERLADADERSVLPPDPEPDARLAEPWQAGSVEQCIGATGWQSLRERLAVLGVTPLVAVSCALSVLLYRYGGHGTVVLGLPVAARSRPELAGTVGFMVNTLPLVLRLFPELGFGALLERARLAVLDLHEGEFDDPVAASAAAARAASDPTRHPFFEVVVAQEPAEVALALPGLQVLEHALPQAVARFDLSLRVRETGAGLRLALDYRLVRQARGRMQALLDQLLRLLHAGVATPDLPLARLPMLDPSESLALRQLAQGPRQSLPERTLAQAFLDRVALHPQRCALVLPQQQWSYHQLAARAAQVARALQAQGVQTGDIVALRFERGPDAVAALLGILMAGAVYLPLDPWHPELRQRLLLQEAQARLLLVPARAVLDLGGLPCPVLALDTVPVASDALPVASAATPGDAAYLLFTSGSTGTPKGVLMSHRAFLDMIEEQIEALAVGESDTVLQFVSPAFDVSLFEIFLALLSGARLALQERALCSTVQGHSDTLAELGVTVAAMTPGFLAEYGPLPMHRLRVLITGGEAPLPALLASRLRQGIRCINAYGPTETAVCAAMYELVPGAPLPVPIPLGQPRRNSSLHVVAPDLTPLPVGVVGELAIGGDHLAIGYHHRPAATEAAFVRGSLAAGDERLYRTGDRVLRRADGQLVFVGRRDAQVKIRGHRVELGEVEAALRALPGVRDARVRVLTRGAQAELVGCWVGDPALAGGLTHALREQLPDYLQPRLQWLASLPLTANGKLDVARLPALSAGREDPADAAQAAPRNPAEAALVRCWAEVLGLDRVGRDEDFFELGGRSLLANRLALRASAALGRTVALRDLYAAATPARLAARLATAADGPEALPPPSPDGRAPLSPMQRRLWVIEQLGSAGPAYHITGRMRWTGPVQPGALQQALDDLVQRHEVLRTRILVQEGEPMAVCDAPASLPLERIEGLPADRLDAQLAHCANRPFDLAREWPLRLVLAHEGGECWQLLTVLHHIAADGWSMPILERELAQAYAARCRGQAPGWTPLAAQYRQLAVWMAHRLADGRAQADRDHWLQRLQPLPAALELPADRPRAAVRRFQGRTLERMLAPATLAAARTLAASQGVTLFSVLLSALQWLLQRLSGQQDVVIGIPVAGRRHPASEGLVGFFVNTLPLRSPATVPHDVADSLRRNAEALREALLHQDYPFDRLVADLQLERDTARSALFDVMLGLDELAGSPAWHGLQAQALPVARQGARGDMAWMFALDDQGALLRLEYDTDLFDEARLHDWVRRFEQLLQQAAAAPHQPLARLGLLLPGERVPLLQWSRGIRPALPAASLHDCVAQQARAHPGRLALVGDGWQWRYDELVSRAGQLARALWQAGARPGQPVALLLARGPWMAAAQLAVMQCGAAYLPMEPDAPPARLQMLLDDSGAGVLVFDADTAQMATALAPERGLRAVQADAGVPAEPAGAEPWAAPQVQPDDAAYIMYTSGSTGRPKGVVATHRGVLRLVWQTDYFTPQHGDRLLQLSNYAFDGATFDFYAALCHGLTLCVPAQPLLLDPPALQAFVHRHAVNIGFVTTALFNRLVDEAPQWLSGWRRLYFGGQEASLPHVRRACAAMAPGALVHVYGPTECTTFASWHTVTSADLCARDGIEPRLPIGRPIAHTDLYLLDGQGELLPPGVPGELWIGGAGVARGYLHQPEVTAQRFVPSPFEAAGRLYRSGDRCVRRADGALEFVGRLDQQVKVRGFRVEPGEVERHLLSHPQVGEACVLPRRNAAGNVELVAYFTGQRQPLPDVAALRMHLGTRLPSYMLPAHWVPMPALPLNANGKVDARALPDPAAAAVTPAAPHDGDRLSALPEPQRVLLEAWQAVLGRDGIGLADNYYALGGDSIQAIQIVSRLRASGWSLAVTDLLRHATVEGLAPLLQRQTATGRLEPSDDGADGEIPLTPVQHWMLGLDMPDAAHFNQSVLLVLPSQSPAAPWRQALAWLQRRHAALRLRFGVQADGQPWQRLQTDAAEPELPVVDFTGADGVARLQADIQQRQRGLQPATGPVWRACLYRLDDGDRLFITIHHWAVDGVSWRLLLADLHRACQALLRGQAIPAEPPAGSVVAWARQLQQATASGRFDAQRGYWLAQLPPDCGRLPRHAEAAGPAPSAQPVGQRLRLSLRLDAERTEALFGACHAAYRTRSDELLLAAVVRALARVQGHPVCRLVLEGHGRDALGPGAADEVVGWLTAIAPQVFADRGDDWGLHIRQVKETLRAIPDGGAGFGALRHLAADGALQAPLGEVVFNYLGRFDAAALPWPVAPESTMDEIDPRLALPQGLDIGAEIRDGELQVRLIGDTERHPAACFESVRDALQQALSGVVAHCLSSQAGGLSPSDVDLGGVGIDDLDRILDQLESS